MRIYNNPVEAIKETERELWEMGIEVQPQTMQDKFVGDDSEYLTKEIRGYAFKIVDWTWSLPSIKDIMVWFFKEKADNVLTYILSEFRERVAQYPTNPGKSYLLRKDLWQEFVEKNGKFAYTYSERLTVQLSIIMGELQIHPETRQAILNIHSNLCPIDAQPKTKTNVVHCSKDLVNVGGTGRVPCSMYYQMMIRERKLDLIYTMRSCDFLTHFPVDISLALLLQDWIAANLELATGTFTYFVGSLHAYHKDIKERGIY